MLTDRLIPNRLVCFRDIRGRPELVRELTTDERAALELRVSSLKDSLEPYAPHDRTACAAAISGMIGGFSVMHRHSGEVAAAITAAYLWTVRERPRWAIEQACSDIRGGKASLAPNYCPNEPEFNVVIGNVLAPYKAKLAAASDLLKAAVISS